MMLPNAYLGSSKFFYLLDFISYRTCITAFSLLPSMYFMGIRNTPLTYVVNWSRRTFISFHKTIAMAMSLLAFIHSCLWTAYTIREGDYAMWAVDAYWQWGMVSMIILGLILFSSLKWFRMVMYDMLFNSSPCLFNCIHRRNLLSCQYFRLARLVLLNYSDLQLGQTLKDIQNCNIWKSN